VARAPGDPKRILVVDDDPKVGAMMRTALVAAGHAVPEIVTRAEDLRRPPAIAKALFISHHTVRNHLFRGGPAR
jgi:CheY-like chemotaxis protein